MENMYVSEQRSFIHITYWVDDRGSFPLGRSGLNKREANMILPDGWLIKYSMCIRFRSVYSCDIGVVQAELILSKVVCVSSIAQ